MTNLTPSKMNGLDLAYLGDACWEVEVRKFLLEEGITRPKRLHQEAVRYVSALSQAKIMTAFLHEERLSHEEEEIFKRGRNSHPHSSAKNASIQDYRLATGFEALMGYVYLSDYSRFKELVRLAFKEVQDEED